jgi:exopolysaccharide biosynthesis polyprenyl glycosylphosphotransferase
LEASVRTGDETLAQEEAVLGQSVHSVPARVRWRARPTGAKVRCVAIIGSGDTAIRAAELHESLSDVVPVVHGAGSLALVSPEEFCRSADEVVVAFAPEDAGHAIITARRLVEDDQAFKVMPESMGCVYPLLEYLGWHEVPVLRLRLGARHGVARVLKRALDVVVASLTLAVLLPLLAVVGLLIRLESPGPVIFKQERVGKNGRRFRIFKFRTMVQGAHEQEARLREECSADPRFVKIACDPRVTRLGRILRKTSIDELPQLWNVLHGEMSLVGPRPSQPSEVALYEPSQFTRLLVKPGVTGMWQVSGRSDLCFEDAVKLDAAYVRDWSLWLDLKIMVKTVAVVLQCRGAC